MALITSLMALFGCNKTAPDTQWSIATGEDNCFPMIIRFRTTIPKGVDFKEYKHLMAIVWKYTPTGGGMPPQEINRRMEEFEKLMEKGIENKGEAIMTAAVTCNGRREWQYYSKTDETFMKLLNSTLSGKSQFPIEISNQSDPDWTAWKQITNSVKTTEHKAPLDRE